MSRSLFLYGIILLALSFACKPDQSVKQSYTLDGNWEIYEAYRDSELTTTLEDGYFTFSDSTMETNILGSPISGTYKLTENTFLHDSRLPIEYEILSYSADTMELSTQVRGFSFKFMLEKKNDTIPEN